MIKSPTAAGSRRGQCTFGFFLPALLLLLLPLLFYLQCMLPPFYSSTASPPTHAGLDSPRVRSLLAARGSTLLHSWSDEELFQRALNTSGANTNTITSSRRQRELQLRHFLVRGSGDRRNTSEATPKVAFLFLTTGELPFEKLWSRFFRGHEKLYNIYVHLDPFRFETASTRNIFWGRYVPSRVTQRASPSLVSAMKRLLANALLDDPANRYFAFISDSCVPLHGFRRVYKRLVNNFQGRSFVEVIAKSGLLWSRYNARGGEREMLPEVPFDKFVVGSQWFVVSRRHAEMLVGESSMWEKFKQPCLDEFSASSCYTEEHYFPTVMNVVDPQGTHNYTLTYVNWPENTDGHPTTFQAKDVSKEFILRLQAEKDGRFMFARKFDPSCLQPLLDLADVILKH